MFPCSPLPLGKNSAEGVCGALGRLPLSPFPEWEEERAEGASKRISQ
jgi:hypothetical protein